MELLMSEPRPDRQPTPNRRWQFSLGTLLLEMSWIALVCMALRSPSELWSALIFIVAFGSLLVAALCIVYRTGRTRAFAVGFVIFGVTYWLISLSDTPEYIASRQPRLPTTRWAIALFSLLHDDQMQVQTRVLAAPVPPSPARATYVTTSIPVPPTVAEVQVTGSTPTSTVPYLVPAPVAPQSLRIVTTTVQQGSTSLASFLEVVHRSLVTLLGILGGIVAQILYSTRREEQPAH
jgi:hypothetical protein